MDNQLQEAITLARSGEREAAQKQLASFLDEKPEEAQGWYLLSLLVESPQKQAAYLSKTLAINPNHLKAQEQLATLQGSGILAPTTTIDSELDESALQPDTAEGEKLPDWLQEEQAIGTPPKPVDETEDTAVANETLPDWLKEPVTIPETANLKPVEEGPTVVGQTSQSDDEADKTVNALRQQSVEETAETQSSQKQVKPKPAASQNTMSLNIILGILIILAVVVVAMLAFLIFSS
ncbi:hypothetical protein [Candidatus Leptofilum sp.]|uniref:hypothetical protein n=1 Tax=Candidatus Leptofilum sp. TaxID=3241576 RepID=UPI003B59BFED